MSSRIDLLELLQQSTSPYHTVQAAKGYLKTHGFQVLSLDEEWNLTEGDYLVDVYGTTVFAFHVGKQARESLRIASAHTDFPAIRVKPNPLMKVGSYGTINVEMYGGLILSTWLDRPLSMAGAVVCRGENPFTPKQILIDVKRPLFVIPNLAIHMNRTMNEGVAYNRQKEMIPLAMMWPTDEECSPEEKWLQILAEEACCLPDDILSFEMTLYPVDEPQPFGIYGEFINGSRLDNITSCKSCLEGIIKAKEEDVNGIRLIALFDNEEVGSRTKQGGAGTILPQIVHRIYGALGYTEEECLADIAGGFMVSADVAHAFHPNYPEKNDVTNKPILNGGMVLKVACSQSYAGDAKAIGIVKALCEDHQIPYQIYVNRSDIPGGSTVGSISSAMMSMRTMDVGIALLSMHSARETMGADDQDALDAFMQVYFTC